jgi:hypothetical protein
MAGCSAGAGLGADASGTTVTGAGASNLDSGARSDFCFSSRAVASDPNPNLVALVDFCEGSVADDLFVTCGDAGTTGAGVSAGTSAGASAGDPVGTLASLGDRTLFGVGTSSGCSDFASNAPISSFASPNSNNRKFGVFGREPPFITSVYKSLSDKNKSFLISDNVLIPFELFLRFCSRPLRE